MPCSSLAAGGGGGGQLHTSTLSERVASAVESLVAQLQAQTGGRLLYVSLVGVSDEDMARHQLDATTAAVDEQVRGTAPCDGASLSAVPPCFDVDVVYAGHAHALLTQPLLAEFLKLLRQHPSQSNLDGFHSDKRQQIMDAHSPVPAPLRAVVRSHRGGDGAGARWRRPGRRDVCALLVHARQRVLHALSCGVALIAQVQPAYDITVPGRGEGAVRFSVGRGCEPPPRLAAGSVVTLHPTWLPCAAQVRARLAHDVVAASRAMKPRAVCTLLGWFRQVRFLAVHPCAPHAGSARSR